jgi:excinuclease ABC subunit A
MPAQTIKITGARQHNLKNLTLEIPRDKLVVITGTSGSGKSSLAFDTLYAEGQRRYVESLSAYARQFLDQMQKPDVDFIEGLSPSIAIEQRSAGGNPRSTIATTTEIYDYLRVLFSAIGQPHDPATGEPVYKQTPQQIVDRILENPTDTRLMVLAPMVQEQAGEFRDIFEKIKREGFVRVRVDGEVIEVGRPEPIRLHKGKAHTIEAVVDRLVVKEGIRTRLADSVDTALKWGGSRIKVLRQLPSTGDAWEELIFSTEYNNPRTNFTVPELTPKHFSFNSHLGACPACQGLGTELVCDCDLMIPDPTKSLKEGAVKPWHGGSKRMQKYYAALLDGLARHFNVRDDVPFGDLPEPFKQALCFGTGDTPVAITWGEDGKRTRSEKPFEGLAPQMQRLYSETESELTRNRIRGYMSRRTCSVCNGARLKPEILAVTVRGESGERNIREICAMHIREAHDFIRSLALTATQEQIVSEVRREIAARLEFLLEVGLGYLALDRESGTLSGGEAQRIRLATQIGSGLAGVLYVLDEPSIGLHQRDNDRLIETLRRLRDLGNTVIVVEHDEDTIRAADYVLDLGPGAGMRGGHLVAAGSPQEILESPKSLTGQYLSHRLRIPTPRLRTAPRTQPLLGGDEESREGWITVAGATENNLKNINVAFPLGCLTCVTGVSGSGKSTLVDDIFRRALFRHFYGSKDRPGKHRAIFGLDQIDKAIVIDQTPIGRTPRSNPVTYTGAFAPVRQLFSQLPASRIRGYDNGRFSFNVKGGRCENCEGGGSIKVEMHFLADVYVPCEVCGGRRYNRETLEVTYKGKNIADVLDMTVDEASRFFRNVPAISDRLVALEDVGLGYIHLGQAANTLSGGEAQRVKLAAELAKKATGRTVYILDEPTTGLHFADIHKLLEVLLKLRDAGNTLVVIEHNLEVIKSADWVIDLGPEGGEAGGRIVGEGPPERIAALDESHTGRYLRRIL